MEARYLDNKSTLEVLVFTRATYEEDKISCIAVEGDFELIEFPEGFGADGCAKSSSAKLGLSQFYYKFIYNIVGDDIGSNVFVSTTTDSGVYRMGLKGYGYDEILTSPTITIDKSNLVFDRSELFNTGTLWAEIRANDSGRTPANPVHFIIDAFGPGEDCIKETEYAILGTPMWGLAGGGGGCSFGGSSFGGGVPDGQWTVIFRATSNNNGSAVKIFNITINPTPAPTPEPTPTPEPVPAPEPVPVPTPQPEPIALPERQTERLDGSVSSAVISGGVRSTNDNQGILNEIIAPQEINVDVALSPEVADIGKSASLFVVVEYQGAQYVFTKSGELKVFTGNNLEAFADMDSLASAQEMTLFSGTLGTADRGSYKVFVGYLLTSSSNLDEIVYNNEAIEFDVL
ncbi:MAG: hypothetical protein Q8K97_13160 [Pseudohongiella sp.]|nr:hypothetical protein [Pseudohongiella sp.]